MILRKSIVISCSAFVGSALPSTDATAEIVHMSLFLARKLYTVFTAASTRAATVMQQHINHSALILQQRDHTPEKEATSCWNAGGRGRPSSASSTASDRSEEHTSE